jgi:uncharacterized protein (DUF433 family)
MEVVQKQGMEVSDEAAGRSEAAAIPPAGSMIVRDPEVRSGKPVLGGTRIGVDTLVGYYRIYGGDIDRILAEFSTLSRTQVEAALSWYSADKQHRAEIDALLR